MDTQQLVTFQKVAKELSFKRSSKELGISQPTVTMRIKALEEELEETLIVRTGQKIDLTPAGKIFLAYVDRAMNVFQFGMDRVIAEQAHQLITIAGTPAVNTFVLPQKLQVYKSEHPDTPFKIYTGSSKEVLLLVTDEIADIGFIRGNIVNQKVHSYRLFSDDLRIVVGRDHSIAGKESIQIRELEGKAILTQKTNSETWGIVEERFEQEGIKPKVIMELDHVTAVKEMAVAGTGVAFLPKVTVEEEVNAGTLKIIELQGPPIRQDTSIVIPNRNLSPAALDFLKFLHAIFQVDKLSQKKESL